MTARAAAVAVLAWAVTGCGNLARDVIVEKGSPIGGDGRAPGDAGTARADENLDAGAARLETSSEIRRCDRDGGSCRKKAEEHCNKYECQEWCQYLCSYISSSDCREKVHCRQSSSRANVP
jgi:hypothetical protein